ncbi:DNA helicase [Favolaschia claudopus]|uniref:DNA helicase n=1 Tax=Favolaschia claudopus TaxID=2862362 RepID=A0AAW0E6D8_9AGAR
MRESNFAFPAQNKACVCITSQLYDRRALDTSSPLPLFNSLTHLTYLTSTSPRIREIMTMDGGLERLVRILRDFCMSPPPPASPAAFYGLLPPNYRAPRGPPQLNPPTGQFDKHAAYRFSLAFQCVVNIGVRGSEPIRSRVVQAGTLDVVGCILEAWLAGRGFAVGPSTSATGLPRETREARAARRAAAAGRGRIDAMETFVSESSTTSPQRMLAIDTSNIIPPRPQNIPEDVYNNYMAANRPGGINQRILIDAAASSSSAGPSSSSGSDLRDDEIDAQTPVVRDRSATVVVRRRGEGGSSHGHARENTNDPVSRHTSAAMHALAQLHAAHLAAQAQGAPPSPSPATGSIISTASTGARTRSRASSVGSPVSSTVSSNRASPSPSARTTDTDTDGDADGDVEMVAAGVAGMGVGAGNHANGHVGRSRVGDSSASASPSPPPLNAHLNMNIPQAAEPQGMMNLNGNANGMNMGAMAGNMNMNMMGMGMGGMMGGGMAMLGMEDPRIAGEEGGDGGAAADMMLGMGMMNGGDIGMLGLDGAMGMLGGGMGMMGMGVNMGMNMGGLTMMGGMPLPMAGGDSEARADTDADAEESDTGAQGQSSSSGLLAPRRREEDIQTQQTPRAGVVRLPSPPSSSPVAGPSSASSSASVYDEEEGDLDEEEGEVVVAVRSSSSNSSSGTMRRASTLRAAQTRLPSSDDGATGSGSTSAGQSTHANSQAQASARQPTASTSSASPSMPTPAPRASQHHTPYPGAPRVPAAPSPAVRARRATAADAPSPPIVPTLVPPTATRTREREDRHHHSHTHPTGPYRDEDVLLSLQLLAYLSKYPHVRQAFYKRRNGFHPASALAVAAAKASETPEQQQPLPKAPEMVREGKSRQTQGGQQLAFLRAFGVSGKEKEKGKAPLTGSSRASAAAVSPPPAPTTATPPSRPGYETNVFSLVERFTFRPSSSETDLPNPPPKLPQEIQYWAGVIMRNACRKDDSRGGIRQCANMLCGRWEEYPREFAKCRRCRKAKYCGKECQSTAWSEGHRFWCKRRERRERYAARERERLSAATTTAAVAGSVAGTTAADAATVRGFRPAGVHSNTVTTVFGGVPAAGGDNAAAGPSRERPAAAPESTRSRAMALLRRTAANANPLGAIGSPPPVQHRRDRERETSTAVNYATFDTYMAERRRVEAGPNAQPTPGTLPGFPNHLHHPQPQNPADIDRYLASFGVPTRRRPSRTGREGESSLPRAGDSTRESSTSGSGSGAGGDQDSMTIE